MVDFAVSALENLLPGISVGSRQNDAEQTFTKRLTQISNTLERQKLHREDIRDLVELTVGRMDIYHVVGTLLLTFCISWYTDNGMMESKLPTWFQTLFLISNFCAVGYLIFSVWLAMHASIACHSIGVRLLTSFARLSIPTRRELDRIHVSITPFLDRFLSLGQKALSKHIGNLGIFERQQSPGATAPGSLTSASPRQAPSKSLCGASSNETTSKLKSKSSIVGDLAARAAGGSFVAGSSLQRPTSEDEESETAKLNRTRSFSWPPSLGAGAADEDDEEEDDQVHFRRFLKEQKRWLCYDAYARVCMSFGMNQMLQALSYYILGVIWKISMVAALTSFFAVKFLGLLLLKLDLGESKTIRKEKYVLVFLYLLPPVLAALLLWVVPIVHAMTDDESPTWVDIVACLCFLLHAGWLVYAASEMAPNAGMNNAPDSQYGVLPRRMRMVQYLDVIQLEQQSMAKAHRSKQVHDRLELVRTSLAELKTKMEEVMEEERKEGMVASGHRRDTDMQKLKSRLSENIDLVAGDLVGLRDEAAKAELRRAERALQHLAIWERAPEVLASLEALRNNEVQDWLKDDERHSIEISYQHFLRQCRELNLGITAALPKALAEDVNSVDASATTFTQVELRSRSDSGSAELRAMHVAPQESPLVRVEAFTDLCQLPQSVWIDTQKHELIQDKPKQDTSDKPSPVSFRHIVQDDLPRWSDDVSYLRRHDSGAALGSMQLPRSVAWDLPEEGQELCASNVSNSGRPVSPRQSMPLIPANARPCDELPGETVRKFTYTTAAWWALAACSFFVKGVYSLWTGHRLPMGHGGLAAAWPEPAGFFEVASLHCNESAVWIGDAFSMYEAPRLSQARLGSLVEKSDLHGATVFCRSTSCHTLMPSIANTKWLLRPLSGQDDGDLHSISGVSGGAAEMQLPADWRLISLAWLSCDKVSCADGLARLVGWDGMSIVVASLNWDSAAEAMEVRRRFKVRPDLGACKDGHPRCREELGKYDHVRDLQLSADGRTLLVLLSDGTLDVWDLTASLLLHRWKLGRGFTSMCLSGKEVLLARQGAAGPLIESIDLPPTVPLVSNFEVAARDADCVSSAARSGFLWRSSQRVTCV